MLEIRFHGRGGQGVVTASNLLAEAAGYDNLYSSSFPIYGAERRGAEIEAYCRISDSPIRVTSPVEEPDYLVVIDNSLLKLSKTIFRGLKKDSKLLVNSPKDVNLSWKTYTVNATRIAIDLGLVKSGWPMVNVIMLGPLVKILGMPKLESLEKAIREEFDGKVAELNIKAVRIAYEQLRESYVLA
ncbi:pyruvate synthase [Sulfolobus sp. A20]|uniref:2-oxoacid:acceptor oxidoreductase family protein n=1 Tax=Sulfolobaceae TaxID=118883 RepID=UPI00084607B8|nr:MULTISPECIES: 2-oxoacid:acceptor oxidoreductase family protein [unclassified Sulfolobus]TRM74421.1 pyruvate synthase [Sulfolobus sp. E5]TRM76329.1 pyruvate synthase [Sulfolobus sp. A20-N-F8]TRM77541.1 pyruvate synthase [Sulfolobus sp. B5]TRM84299.1 pyruvate synthase [Sulfolobus sp. A20-N-F6]TRM89618.1 pyruvate synthase [Sulfolobus sp. C3]TRM98626.1 pyruvate synthase [Sulfolobus sp. F1]TRN04704.1 pyruvate synthase [Sulfolobus sp. E1]